MIFQYARVMINKIVRRMFGYLFFAKGKTKAVLNDEYFSQKDKVYLSSADQYLGFQKVLSREKLLECRNFYSVIGGMGGLNILSRLRDIKKIILFDINPYCLFVAKIYIRLIKESRSRDEFVSLFYLRTFQFEKYTYKNQSAYYSKPINNLLLKRLKKILGVKLFEFYKEMYLPYVRRPDLTLYNGPSTHCTDLRLFHEAKISGVMVNPYRDHNDLIKQNIKNYNSLFFGKGWLKSEITYKHVRKNILGCEIKLLRRSIFDLDFEENSGLYASNVFEGVEENFAETIYKFNWALWYSKESNYLSVDYVVPCKRRIPVKKIYGGLLSDPHVACCIILDQISDFHNRRFVEVIEPHIVEGMNFGFRFYEGQIPVSVDEFLNNRFDMPDVEYIGIHILLGNGCDLRRWKKVVKKSLKQGVKVFVFEHRKDCKDWPEWDVYEENIPDEFTLDSLLLELNCNWDKYGTASLRGNDLDVRNLCWVSK